MSNDFQLANITTDDVVDCCWGLSHDLEAKLEQHRDKGVKLADVWETLSTVDRANIERSIANSDIEIY